MAKQSKYEHPTNSFPYKIPRRLNMLSVPRKIFYESMEGMPGYTDMGIRKSALRGVATDRVNDISWPWVRRLMLIKKRYKNRFSPERIERIDRMIESANVTMYSKLANCAIDLKNQDTSKDTKKKKGWSESEWKKHMDYISSFAGPKKTFRPPPIKRGKSMPLEALMPRINEISSMPKFKCYIRESKEAWYRDPIKVPRRIQMLSAPRKQFIETGEGMPKYTKSGIRQSALRGRLNNSDIAWPYLRSLIALKRMYKNKFSPERLQVIDRMIEASNATFYSKLANCAMDLRKSDRSNEVRKKKSWSSSEWKKHTEYLSQIAAAKKVFQPPQIKRGKSMPLEALQPRIDMISTRPDFKCYKKLSDEEWYRNPEKVSPSALTYEITERTKKLAVPRVNPGEDN